MVESGIIFLTVQKEKQVDISSRLKIGDIPKTIDLVFLMLGKVFSCLGKILFKENFIIDL